MEILRFDLVMAIFRLFGSFFAIYPLLILKESVDRTKWHRDLKFGIWDLYMVINWSLKYLINILKITSGFVAKTKNWNISAIEKQEWNWNITRVKSKRWSTVFHGQYNMWLHKISAFSQQKHKLDYASLWLCKSQDTPPNSVLTNNREHSDRLRVNINRSSDVTFYDYSNCKQ